MTPTARSLAWLRDAGWLVDVVERRITGRIKRDLFGMFDLLALKDGQVLFVQVTTGSNVAARATKIRINPNLATVQLHGLPVVHGWRKLKRSGKWEVRVIEIR